MIIREADAKKKAVGVMNIKEYEINSDFSGALIEIDGDHGAIKCLEEDRIYFIMDGSGTFIIDSHENEVSKDDLIFVPKNTPYNIIGKMRFFMVCSPEFNPDHDVHLE